MTSDRASREVTVCSRVLDSLHNSLSSTRNHHFWLLLVTHWHSHQFFLKTHKKPQAIKYENSRIMSKGGGDLFDMAKDGTTVPEDAAKPRIIPSVPRPDQIASESDPNSLEGADLAGAADNAQDIPRVR